MVLPVNWEEEEALSREIGLGPLREKIVLDDYHTIRETQVHALVDPLLKHLPSSMRWVVPAIPAIIGSTSGHARSQSP